MKKHIWILNHYAGDMFFDKGGRHYNFAKYLKHSGYEPVIFCSNAQHGPAKRFFETDALWQEHMAEEIGVPFVYVRSRTYTGNGKQRILNMMDFYRNIKKTAKEYATQHGKPDIIYASSVHPLTLVAGLQIAKHFGVKCICEVRDLWPESIVAYGIAGPRNPAVLALRCLEKWTYQKADAMIFTMEGAYDYIVEQGWEKDIPRSKVFYINNGVDLEVFNENRDRWQVQDEDLDDPNLFKVVYTGSVRRVNNLGVLLDAAKQIKTPRVKFLIWGAGDELEALQKRVADEHIENVVFKGRVEKKYVPYIVSRADVNIAHNTASPLFRFGISFNKLFDYLAAGKPVLTDFSYRYNPVIQWGAGVDVQTPTEESIAAAVEDIAHMDEKTYKARCEGAYAAAKEFDFSNLTKRLVDVIEA